MDIQAINATLRAEAPETLIVQSYDARGRRLVVAFTCAGGPREDEAFVLEFEQTILFHLPSVLYGPVVFRAATESERSVLIPGVSYDADEVSGRGGAYTVLLLENEKGVAYGYYLAADEVQARWTPRSACRDVW